MNKESWPALLVCCVLFGTSAASCSPESGGGENGSETSADACSDGMDNDGDDLVDCDDPACTGHTWCGNVGGDGDSDIDADVDADGDADSDSDGDIFVPSECAIDVVFVIDVSTSMVDEVVGVRSGIESIWAAAAALTTDTQFSLIVFVDDVVAVNNCGLFASIETLQAEFDRWRDFASTNNQPGGAAFSNSDCPENSLDALYTAATVCPWRDDATRITIHVTDDTFREHPARLSAVFGMGGIQVQHTYAEVAAALTENEVRVGAFAAPGAGEFCGAGTSPNVGQGFHEAFAGQPSLPDATGGRAWSIRDVRAGTLDMAEAINAMIEEEYCTPYLY